MTSVVYLPLVFDISLMYQKPKSKLEKNYLCAMQCETENGVTFSLLPPPSDYYTIGAFIKERLDFRKIAPWRQD